MSHSRMTWQLGEDGALRSTWRLYQPPDDLGNSTEQESPLAGFFSAYE